MSVATKEQPAPTSSTESQPVLPWLMELLLTNGRRVLGRDLSDRAELGKSRYGTYLMTHNGRKPMADLYQELLDALMYLAQYQLESGEDMAEQFVELKLLAMWVKGKLMEDGK